MWKVVFPETVVHALQLLTCGPPRSEYQPIGKGEGVDVRVGREGVSRGWSLSAGFIFSVSLVARKRRARALVQPLLAAVHVSHQGEATFRVSWGHF